MYVDVYICMYAHTCCAHTYIHIYIYIYISVYIKIYIDAVCWRPNPLFAFDGGRKGVASHDWRTEAVADFQHVVISRTDIMLLFFVYVLFAVSILFPVSFPGLSSYPSSASIPFKGFGV